MRSIALIAAATLVGCVSVTTRATIALGPGGSGELEVAVGPADTLVVSNSGHVSVEMLDLAAPGEPKPVRLGPGESRTLLGGRYRLTFANRTDRDATVEVVGSGTPSFTRR